MVLLEGLCPVRVNVSLVSITYALMSRCGLEPENYFEHEDFLSIFDFNTQATTTALGKYGLLRRRYLKEHRPVLWEVMQVNGTLFSHLLEAEDQANEMLEQMMPSLAQTAGATEQLKARDPMSWVGLMNACKAQAEEITFSELIYG